MRPLYLLPLLLVVGCNPAPAPTAKDAPATTSGATGTTGGKPAPPEVPAALKGSAAHAYYGLDNPKPMPMEMTSSNQPGVSKGVVTVTLDKVEGGKATYKVERTEDLARLGSNDLTLGPDGLFVTATSEGTMDGPQIELPLDVAPGKAWSVKSSITQPTGQVVTSQASLRAVREEDVKTKAGTRRALLVVSEGPASLGDQRVRMSTRTWYAKGRGAVRMEVTVVPVPPPGGKPLPKSTMLIQETK